MLYRRKSIGTVIGALAITTRAERRFTKNCATYTSGHSLSSSESDYALFQQSFGVAISFPLSQLDLVLSTIGGGLFLKEEKTKNEHITIIIGLVLIFWYHLNQHCKICEIVSRYQKSIVLLKRATIEDKTEMHRQPHLASPQISFCGFFSLQKRQRNLPR
jgi:hypothetical protein